MDLSKTIEKYLKILGKPINIVSAQSGEIGVCAVIEQTWKRNKSHFEDHSSKIGRHYNDYYHYVGPVSYDITSLSRDDYIEADGERYYFIQKECVKVGGVVQFYRGILKKAEEADGDVFIS